MKNKATWSVNECPLKITIRLTSKSCLYLKLVSNKNIRYRDKQTFRAKIWIKTFLVIWTRGVALKRRRGKTIKISWNNRKRKTRRARKTSSSSSILWSSVMRAWNLQNWRSSWTYWRGSHGDYRKNINGIEWVKAWTNDRWSDRFNYQ